MKNIFVFTGLFIALIASAQERYFTKSGHVNFFSQAPLEDITASNDQVAVILDAETGKLTFAMLIKSFEFEKALMQEHFNENYLESDEFPRSKFTGQIISFEELDLKKSEEVYKVKVEGKLTIHGVTKDISADGELKIGTEEIIATSKIIVKPEDYEIKIPKAVRDNVAKEIEVNIKAELKLFSQ